MEILLGWVREGIDQPKEYAYLLPVLEALASTQLPTLAQHDTDIVLFLNSVEGSKKQRQSAIRILGKMAEVSDKALEVFMRLFLKSELNSRFPQFERNRGLDRVDTEYYFEVLNEMPISSLVRVFRHNEGEFINKLSQAISIEHDIAKQIFLKLINNPSDLITRRKILSYLENAVLKSNTPMDELEAWSVLVQFNLIHFDSKNRVFRQLVRNLKSSDFNLQGISAKALSDHKIEALDVLQDQLGDPSPEGGGEELNFLSKIFTELELDPILIDKLIERIAKQKDKHDNALYWLLNKLPHIPLIQRKALYKELIRIATDRNEGESGRNAFQAILDLWPENDNYDPEFFSFILTHLSQPPLKDDMLSDSRFDTLRSTLLERLGHDPHFLLTDEETKLQILYQFSVQTKYSQTAKAAINALGDLKGGTQSGVKARIDFLQNRVDDSSRPPDLRGRALYSICKLLTQYESEKEKELRRKILSYSLDKTISNEIRIPAIVGLESIHSSETDTDVVDVLIQTIADPDEDIAYTALEMARDIPFTKDASYARLNQALNAVFTKTKNRALSEEIERTLEGVTNNQKAFFKTKSP